MSTPQDSSPPVGKILLIVGAVILVVWLICGGLAFYAYSQWKEAHPTGVTVQYSRDAPSPRVPQKPLPDADLLAARMKWGQEIYPKLRDDAITAYQQQHPTPTAADTEAHACLKLIAYLCVYGDYYGEGLWQQYDVHAGHFGTLGPGDSVFTAFENVNRYYGRHSENEDIAAKLDDTAFDFGTTPYPAIFKFTVYRMAYNNIFETRADTQGAPPDSKAFADAPKLLDAMMQCYAGMVGDHLPDWFLYGEAESAFDAASRDETTLDAVSTGLDHVFDTQDKGNPLATALKAEFYVKSAWCARGGGWSNSVSNEGWQLFNDRLAKANQICTDLYAAHPDEPATPRVMMSVVLGQGQSRDQMETWFQRGLKLNPGGFTLRMAKRWYLLPRWYGSDEDVWNFGLECSTSDDWADKVPLIVVEAITDAAERDPSVYAHPDTWQPLEKVFRGYLDHFPNSVRYRSRFIKCAVAGAHWDVAAEQLKVLGDDWDRSVFEGDEYEQTKRLVASHTGGL